MKTLSNVLILILGAFFFVPKVIDKKKAVVPEYSIITNYEEPYEIRKGKQNIELLQGEIKIVIKETQLVMNKIDRQ